MLEPGTNEIKGFVSNDQLLKDLDLDVPGLRRFVMYENLYKGCILIEDESCCRKWERNDEIEYRLIAENDKGYRWYATSDLNILSISPKGIQKILKIRECGSVRVNGKVVYPNRVCYEAFHDIKLSSKQVVVLNGTERNVKNLVVQNIVENINGGRRKKVAVGDIVYDSIKECAAAYHYTYHAIYRMLKGTRGNTIGVRYV